MAIFEHLVWVTPPRGTGQGDIHGRCVDLPERNSARAIAEVQQDMKLTYDDAEHAVLWYAVEVTEKPGDYYWTTFPGGARISRERERALNSIAGCGIATTCALAEQPPTDHQAALNAMDVLVRRGQYSPGMERDANSYADTFGLERPYPSHSSNPEASPEQLSWLRKNMALVCSPASAQNLLVRAGVLVYLDDVIAYAKGETDLVGIVLRDDALGKCTEREHTLGNLTRLARYLEREGAGVERSALPDMKRAANVIAAIAGEALPFPEQSIDEYQRKVALHVLALSRRP